MGTADRYCAICGCSIGIGSLIIGSNSKKAKGIRQRLLEAGLRQRAGELTGDNEEHGYSDEDSALNILDLEHSYAIEHAYDPKVMECRDVALSNFDRFYKHVRLVMYDPKIENSSKYFISGETEVDDFGWGTVLGGHPSRPDEQFENVMYMEYSEEDVKAFPCHGLCLQMLAKAVSGKFDSKLLNPEVLYKIMYDLNENDGQMLNIGYGDVSGQEQYWECMPGEEYAVINPLEFYDQHMRKLMSLTIDSGTMAKNANGSETHDTTVDPFHALSNELIHHITRYLSGNEVFSLRQASTLIRQSTSGNSYWKPRVEKDLQWLWIPPGLDRKTASGEIGGGNRQIDWMKVYGLFDSATAHPWGMKGKYMGLANRRRIWTVCEELRSLYKAYAARSGESIINPDVDRRTWSESDEIDTLWRAAFERLESSERWMGCKDCRDG